MPKSKKLFKILKIIITALVLGSVALLAAVVVFFVCCNAAGTMPYIGDRSVVLVRTGSMEPLIPAQSYILVSRIEAKDVEVGDVLIYISDDPEIAGQYNTHRVVEIIGDNAEFVMKGDNNIGTDRYNARAENIVGAFEDNLPRISAIARFLSGRRGVIMSVTVIIAIFAAVTLPIFIRREDELKAEAEADKNRLIEELVAKEVERLRAEGLEIQQTAKTRDEDPRE